MKKTILLFIILVCAGLAAHSQSLLIDNGTANSYQVSYPANFSGATPPAGIMFTFKAINANTGTSTLKLNGYTTVTIKKNYDQLLQANDIKANAFVTVIFDGTFWQMLSVSSNPLTGGQWTTNGSNIYYSTGAVGIGTSTPTADLHVYGSGLYLGSASNNFIFDLGTLSVSNQTLNSGGTKGYRFLGYGDAYVTPTLQNDLRLAYYNGGTPTHILNIDKSGKIGIGMGSFTVEPLNTLDVNGSVGIGSYAGASAAPANGLIVSGSVGIGTINPLTHLHVFNANLPGIYIDQDGTNIFGESDLDLATLGNNVVLANAATKGWRFAAFSNAHNITANQNDMILKFYNGIIPTPVLYFDSQGGNVGINTNAAINKLDVGGNATIGLGYASVNTAPLNGLLVQGNVALGTTTPFNKLDINGAVAIGAYAGVNSAPSNSLIVSGSVGIGNSTPTTNLHITGGVRIEALSSVGSNLVQADLNGNLSTASLSSYNIITGGGVSATNKIPYYVGQNSIFYGSNFLFDGGSMAIGGVALSSNYIFQVQASTTYPAIYGISSVGAGSAIWGYNNNVTAGSIGVVGAGTGGGTGVKGMTSGAGFGVHGTNAGSGPGGYFENTSTGPSALFIGGSVGIGTTTPNSLFHVSTSGFNGYATIIDNSGPTTGRNGILINTGNITSATTLAGFTSGGLTRLLIPADGNVSIPNGGTLKVSSDISGKGMLITSFYSTSVIATSQPGNGSFAAVGFTAAAAITQFPIYIPIGTTAIRLRITMRNGTNAYTALLVRVNVGGALSSSWNIGSAVANTAYNSPDLILSGFSTGWNTFQIEMQQSGVVGGNANYFGMNMYID